MAIIIGSPAIDRPSQIGTTTTIVLLENPATLAGTITDIEIWVNEDMAACKIGTFQRNGDQFKSRGYAIIEDIAAGGKRTYSDLEIPIAIGDYLGFYGGGPRIDVTVSGFDGIYRLSDDQFDGEWHTYSFTANWTCSAHGIGQAPPPPSAKRSYAFIIG